MNQFESPLRLPAALCWLQRKEFPRKLGLCDRVFGRSLAQHGIQWVPTAPGPVWKLDLTNQTHRWIVYGYYEGPSFWRWLHRQNDLRVIVDSGANIGQTVLYFASLLPEARILAYEPGSAARSWLTESVSANRFARVQIEPSGLGRTAGTARLAVDGAEDRHGAWNKIRTDEGEPVTLVTLDGEMRRLGISSIDLWKLDMEGYEPEALRGAEQALAGGQVRHVYVEAAGETGRESLALLTGLGYRVHGIDDAGRLQPWNARHAYDSALCLAPDLVDHP